MRPPIRPCASPGTLDLSVPGASRQHERWERIGLGIRLAYNPWKPQVVPHWIALGSRLVDAGVQDELWTLQRTLRLLIQVAHDEGLPWFWRSVCLEFTARPLARATSILRSHDPARAEALQADVQGALQRLEGVPAAARGGRP